MYLVKTKAADFKTEISFPPPGARKDRHRKNSHLEDTGVIDPRMLFKR